MNINRCTEMGNFPEAMNPDGFKDMNMNMNMGMGMGMGMPMGSACCPGQAMMCPPIYECPQVRCCHRVINYEVPHIIPCHTKVINHHIYRHSYQPTYSYSEEDECSEVYGPNCCR